MRYEQCKAMQDIREIEFRDSGSNANIKICFEVRATALRPCLHTEGFPLRPHMTSHKRNLHIGIYNYTVRSTQFLSQPYTTSHRGNTNTTSHKRGRHLANTTRSPHTWGIPTQTPPLTRGSQPPLQNQHLHKRDTRNKEGYNLGGLSQPQRISFTK